MLLLLSLQVLPQLLNYITNTSLYSLDFASIYVYTCSASCEAPKDTPTATGAACSGSGDDGGARIGVTNWSGQYCAEFAWAQVDTSVKPAPPKIEPDNEAAGGNTDDNDDDAK